VRIFWCFLEPEKMLQNLAPVFGKIADRDIGRQRLRSPQRVADSSRHQTGVAWRLTLSAGPLQPFRNPHAAEIQAKAKPSLMKKIKTSAASHSPTFDQEYRSSKCDSGHLRLQFQFSLLNFAHLPDMLTGRYARHAKLAPAAAA